VGHRIRFGLFLVTVAAAATATAFASAPQASRPQDEHAAQIERGRYLVTVLACNDCHTPMKMGPHGPEPDMSRMLSGHPESLKMPAAPKLAQPWMWAGAVTNTAFAGPWGVSYAINLTPDPNTGLGIWTEDMFLKALRTGRHMGTSRPILPPMPWMWLKQASDSDLKAMFAYLRSIKPIVNHVPDPQPPVQATGGR